MILNKGVMLLNTMVKKSRVLYLLLIIPVLHLIVFSYLPMYGVIIAFKDFRIMKGILGSPWNDFEHFRTLLTDPFFKRAFFNTIKISLLRLIFGFPAPIIFALLLNEVAALKFKKTVQTISYLPHFISWVVIGGLFRSLLSSRDGAINYLIVLFGGKPINILAEPVGFIVTLIVTGIWQGVGWGSIIYLASISSIDPGLYDSARIDGANRFQMALKITIPSITNSIVILYILSLGGILSAGFDQVFNLYNPLVYPVADIIDTFVFRKGIVEARYDFSAAVGLFKNVVGVGLVLLSNAVIRKRSEYSLW